jgi:hypothetical protein
MMRFALPRQSIAYSPPPTDLLRLQPDCVAGPNRQRGSFASPLYVPFLYVLTRRLLRASPSSTQCLSKQRYRAPPWSGTAAPAALRHVAAAHRLPD